MITDQVPGISKLSPQEKWILAAELWDEVFEELTAIPESDAQRVVVKDRWESYLADPDSGSSWEEIKAKLGKS